MQSPQVITDYDIEKLNPEQLEELLRALLRLEAHEHNLNPDQHGGSHRINAGDGGQDRFIIYREESQSLFNRKVCLFQCKAQTLPTNSALKMMIQKKNKKSESFTIKPWILKSIEEDGAIIFLIGANCENTVATSKGVAVRTLVAEEIKEVYKENGKEFNDADLTIYFAAEIANWVNKNHQTIRLVDHYLDRHGLDFYGCTTIDYWFERHKIEHIVDSNSLKLFRSSIINILKRANITNIVGCSGIGKTTTAYQIAKERSLNQEGVDGLYLDCSLTMMPDVKTKILELAKQPILLIVDNAKFELFDYVYNNVNVVHKNFNGIFLSRNADKRHDKTILLTKDI